MDFYILIEGTSPTDCQNIWGVFTNPDDAENEYNELRNHCHAPLSIIEVSPMQEMQIIK